VSPLKDATPRSIPAFPGNHSPRYLVSGRSSSILERAGQRVVVVCPGGVIGASFIALGDRPRRDGIAFTHETVKTSLTEWRVTGSGWRLVRYDDAAHLAAS
jgi:hypothetical protein